MKKCVIGVVPLVDYEKQSWWMLPGYMEGILEAGGLPLMLPLTGDREVIRQIADQCDGFLLTGGQDVSPELYGEKRLPQCGECSPERDRMEKMLLEEALHKNIPVLGICRGIQFLNAALGGTLYQDLPSQRGTGMTHCQKPPYDVPVHEVEIKEGTPLYDLLGCRSLAVNSYHHQAVETPAPGFVVSARGPKGIIEAMERPGSRFWVAVQWHPEMTLGKDEFSIRIFEAFLRAVRGEEAV